MEQKTPQGNSHENETEWYPLADFEFDVIELEITEFITMAEVLDK